MDFKYQRVLLGQLGVIGRENTLKLNFLNRDRAAILNKISILDRA
jgi:hypothetical protein